MSPPQWTASSLTHLYRFSQSESELVAKDDNLDAAEPSKDQKQQDKDEEMCEEEKEKIHEQGDEVTEVHPQHSSENSQRRPRVGPGSGLDPGGVVCMCAAVTDQHLYEYFIFIKIKSNSERDELQIHGYKVNINVMADSMFN